MVGPRFARPALAFGLLGLCTLAPRPASAQVGLPPPPGVDPYSQPGSAYAPPPQSQFLHPVALGLGISLLTVGAGMLVGGFIVVANPNANQAVGGALLSVGGAFFAGGIPLVIYGAQTAPAYPAPGYGPMMSRNRWIGAPRVLLPNAREGRPFGLAWSWQL